MPTQTREVLATPDPRCVRTEDGALLQVPASWELLPPGDAALTRRVKQSGPTWTVREQRGRRKFSRGVWACAQRIDSLRTELAQERRDPRYQRKLEQGRQRRAAKEIEYAQDFCEAVFRFLGFHPRHTELAMQLALEVTRHAAGVGSGTVARTKRIPLEQRAEAAVIAWLRHQTTSYDDMRIPRVKGMRREVRRTLAERSRRLLSRYRNGDPVLEACPLHRALANPSPDLR